jgi:hypothetical protein
VIPRTALRDAMIGTAGLTGLTGNLTCNATGDCADPKIAVYEGMSSDRATWNPGAAEDSNPKKIWPEDSLTLTLSWVRRQTFHPAEGPASVSLLPAPSQKETPCIRNSDGGLQARRSRCGSSASSSWE